MQQDYNQAAAYVSALTGQPAETAQLWFRCIHDTNKEIPAHKYYGTLPALWETLVRYNADGWGIFCNINEFAPNEQEHILSNVKSVRVQVVDLDNIINSQQNYQLAANSNPAPSFAVNTSPNKFHIYWKVATYLDNERYTALQRKLRQTFDGDRSIIDPTRVLRVPGFYHLKNPAQPYLVTCWALAGYGQPLAVETLEAAYSHVNVIDTGGGRHDLGDPELAAPSLDWLKFALSLIDPNSLDRGEWISTTAAIKQAGWSLATEDQLFQVWSDWCARYAANDTGENLKQWNSIRDTETGWKSLYYRAPTLKAYEKFGFKEQAPTVNTVNAPEMPDTSQQTEELPDIINEYQCAQYFKNCYWIGREGKILTPLGRLMNSTQFNGEYGGKLFIITPDGKVTDEPWKAALRSPLWTVPKIDHLRFDPQQKQFAILTDQLGRKGVNTYIPVKIKATEGNVYPFLRHMEFMFPVESDRQIIYAYLAHNVKFPGFKIPWAPMIQSTEGTGKGFLIQMLESILGDMYVYRPKAEELVKSGSTFNAWQRGKLMIVVDEIKVDERRELIEVLKPLITEKRAEIQSKGVDQEMEDNPANWLFFSNYKDAIPIYQNGRRYAIFYSALQSKDDLRYNQMNDEYFIRLFTWLETGGSEAIAHWLLNYPIERGQIPRTAPETSSKDEAIRVSRGPIDRAILNAVQDGLPGFRGGYISTLAVINRMRQLGGRAPAQSTVERILEAMGYFDIGRAPRAFSQENMNEKTQLFGVLRDMSPLQFGRVQGYE